MIVSTLTRARFGGNLIYVHENVLKILFKYFFFDNFIVLHTLHRTSYNAIQYCPFNNNILK